MTVRLLHYADLEDAYDDPGRIGRLAGLLAARRTDRTLVVGSGDDLAFGALETMTDRGKREALAFFDAVGSDLDTVGNHDLDEGPSAFLDVAEDSPVTWVCSNLRLDGEPFGTDAGVRETVVREIGGERVGFFGLAHPDTPEIAHGAGDLEVTDPVQAARDAVATLRDEGVDHVVCLSHLGESDAVAAAVDLDLVLEGHHHDRRVERVDGTPIARSAGNGDDLTEVTLDDGASFEVHHVEQVGDEEVDDAVHDGVVETYRGRRREVGADEVVATLSDPVERTYSTRFHGESRPGNLVADAYRWATGADVAVFPSGGIRSGDPLDGEVTASDIVATVPYDESLVTCSVSGEALTDLFAHAEGESPADQPPWWHFQLGGGRVVWDHAAAELVEFTIGGDPVDPEATYAVATTEYVVDYDGIPITPADRVEEHGAQYRAVVEFLRERDVEPALEGRVERRNLPE